MWKSVVDKDFDNAMLADALCEAYEVDRETAKQDVARGTILLAQFQYVVQQPRKRGYCNLWPSSNTSRKPPW